MKLWYWFKCFKSYTILFYFLHFFPLYIFILWSTCMQVRCEYSMANFSTGDRTRRPKGDRFVLSYNFMFLFSYFYLTLRNRVKFNAIMLYLCVLFLSFIACLWREAFVLYQCRSVFLHWTTVTATGGKTQIVVLSSNHYLYLAEV